MSSLEITTPHSKRPNTAGGVDVLHRIYNASEKEIKYVSFTYIPLNQVGDVVKCKIKDRAEAYCKFTGPIAPGEETLVSWENLWYNPTVDSVKITEMKIEYTDGTVETVAGEDIIDTSHPESKFGKIEREKERRAKMTKRIVGGVIGVIALILLITSI